MDLIDFALTHNQGSLKKQIRRSTDFVGLIDFIGLIEYTFVHNQRHLMWWHIWQGNQIMTLDALQIFHDKS